MNEQSNTLVNSNFFKLMIAYIFSGIGSWFRRIAVIGLLFKLTHSPMVVGISFILRYLPMFLSNLFLSFFINKVRKKTVIILSNALGGIGAILLSLYGSSPYLYLIYTILVIINIADAIYEPVRISIIPEIISDRKKYGASTAIVKMCKEVTMLFGTALGGILVIYLGASIIFSIDAATYFFSLLVISFIHDKYKKDTVISNNASLGTGVFKGFYDAIHEIFSSSYVGVSFILSITRQFSYGIAIIAFTLLVLKKFQLGEDWLGWAYTIGGAGAIIGGSWIRKALLTSPPNESNEPKRLLSIALINCIAIYLMFSAPWVSIFLIFVFLHDITSISTEILAETNILTFSSEKYRAPISSLIVAVDGVALLGGSIFYTFVLSRFSLDITGYILSLVFLTGVLIGFLIQRRERAASEV